MIKSLKQYSFLRGLLARRLRAKKREIEAIKAKNRFFVSNFGLTINLSEIDRIEITGIITIFPDTYFLEFRDKDGNLITSIKTKEKKNIEKEFFRASEQLKQLRAYD